jgi:hypothetical protein
VNLKNIKILLITKIAFNLLIYSNMAMADFIAGAVSYERFENTKFKGAQTSLVGPGYNLAIGFQGKFPFQLAFSHSTMLGTVNHDDKDQTIELTYFSYGIRKSIFINTNVYLNFGYMIQDLKFKFPDSSNVGEAGIKNYYQIEDQESEGVVYGIGYNLQKGTSSNFYIEYNIQQQSTMNSTVDSFHIGYRFKND